MEKDFVNWVEKRLGTPISVTKEIHGDQSDVFRIEFSDKKYFLKIGKELEKERERLEWLKGKLLVPNIIGFTHISGKDGLLLSEIEGENLATLSKKWSGDKIVDKLAEALRRFHATDATGFPFGVAGADKVLIHGDACLPNFMFKNDIFSGYIDLGDLSIDYREVDLAAAVWSLQYNLGSEYGLMFLQKYGIENPTQEMVKEFLLQYEKMQEAWGLR